MPPLSARRAAGFNMWWPYGILVCLWLDSRSAAMPLCPPPQYEWVNECPNGWQLSTDLEGGFPAAMDKLLQFQQMDLRVPKATEYPLLLTIFEGLRISECLVAYSPCVPSAAEQVRSVCQTVTSYADKLRSVAKDAEELVLAPLQMHMCGNGGTYNSVRASENVLLGGLQLCWKVSFGHSLLFPEERFEEPQQVPAVGVQPLLYPAHFSPGNVCGEQFVGGFEAITWDWAASANEFRSPWLDVSGHYSAFHFSSTALLHKLASHGIPLSRFVINLGSSDGRCTGGSLYDPANCLLADGYGGILFEGQEVTFVDLARRFGTRADVHLKLGWTSPSAAVAAVEAVAAPRSPDLLKVDVDNCDSCFVEAVLNRYDPKLIHVEFEAELPPAIVRKHPFVETPGAFGPRHGAPGSLGAFIEVVRPRYKLLHVEFVNALFVRSDLMHILDQGFPAAGRSDEYRWRLGYFCHPLRSTWKHSPGARLRRERQADTSIFGDPTVPISKLYALAQELIFDDDPPGTEVYIDRVQAL